MRVVFGNFLPEDRQIGGYEAFSSRLRATFNAPPARYKARQRLFAEHRLPHIGSRAYTALQALKTLNADFRAAYNTRTTAATKTTEDT